MTDDLYREARERIGAQRGELRGWRPLVIGDVAVVALQVLGTARHDDQTIGLRVVVAGRSADAIQSHGRAAAERALRKRSVIGDGDPFVVVDTGPLRDGTPESADPIDWPWIPLVIHVPMRQLPAIAGLATDTVPTVF